MPCIPRIAISLTMLTALSLYSLAQTPAPPPQTARQALIEMITNGGDAIIKHLTVEVQDLLKSPGASDRLKMTIGSAKAESGTETFDTGDILFAYNDPSKKERYEVHVESEDFSSDEDSFLLSVHNFHEGKEIDGPFPLSASRFTVSLKLQQNIWRLNKISVQVDAPVGDQEFVKNTFHLGTFGLGATAGDFAVATPQTSIQFGTGSDLARPGEQTAVPPEQIVFLLTFAERGFATAHPDTGFTCSLKDLSEASKNMGLNEQANAGTYNGYRYALSGCEGMPSGSFQIVAEPLLAANGAKAFCSDATGNIRASNDGRGATCLTHGQVQTEEAVRRGDI